MSIAVSRHMYLQGETKTTVHIEELFSQEVLKRRVKELAGQISADFRTRERPVVIGVLKGALLFMADLLRALECVDPVQVEFVRLASYGEATESSGVVQAPYLDLPNIAHRHILVVEDIVDSGRTAHFFLDYLQGQFAPASLSLATLLDKPSRRVVPLKPNYVGFEIDDVFVLGYGLDYAEQFRELPFLGHLLNPQDA
jgi:hypoxanthine phosphoribosyltransferase